MTFPQNMSPQYFPLGCLTQSGASYVVLGWTPDGQPVVVGSGRGKAAARPPHVLTEAVAEYSMLEGTRP